MANVTVKDNSKEILAAIAQARERALEKIGLVAECDAKRLCAVDTGRLRNSITHVMSGESVSFSYSDDNGNNYSVNASAPSDEIKSVYIGTNVEYAPSVEFGTRKQSAKPFLRPAATGKAQTYSAIIQSEYAQVKT